MTTEAHLDLILTFCRSRLELAEKRTPGTWRHMPCSAARGIRSSNYIVVPMATFDAEDAAFIAACAGAAEAGWRDTIGHINFLRRLRAMAPGQHILNQLGIEESLVCSDYPLELLQPTT